MPNEREVKTAARTATCSVTGKCCRCRSGGGCVARLSEPLLDEIPRETVRQLRSARILIEAAIQHLDEIQDDYLRRRAYPGPEVRETRRKLVTSIAMIDEIGGEL